jgi:flagellar FliL protein
MADDDLDEDEKDGGEDEGDSSSGGGSKKLIIIIIVAVLLLLIGGGAAAYFMGVFDTSPQETEVEPSEDSKKAAEDLAFFHDLPDITVNLNAKGRKRSVMKLKISLEVGSPDEIPKLQALMPRVIDNFQVYLRELRLDDLKGSAGMYRLREELMMRVNAAISPAKVKAVLFKEMLVQ